MILEKFDWKEFHPNGKIWIVGKIGVVADMWKHLYDTRTGFKGFEGKPVCRLGVWQKYYDNGQLAWSLDYGDGTLAYKKQDFPTYTKSIVITSGE